MTGRIRDVEGVNRKHRAMSRQYIDDNREALREIYTSTHSRARKPRQLTKKERKALGLGRDRGVAQMRNVRVNPLKANVVCRLIRGKDLAEARAILTYTNKAVAPILEKLLRSAEANAINNNELDSSRLYVADCQANEGPLMKRIMPRARGSAHRILKRTSHLSVVLKERE